MIKNKLVLEFKYIFKKELYNNENGLVPFRYRKNISIALEDAYKLIDETCPLYDFLELVKKHRLYKLVPKSIRREFEDMCRDNINSYYGDLEGYIIY